MLRVQRLCIIVLAIICCSVKMPAAAQDYVLNELYGNGVHAFFSGNYEEALNFLDEAVEEGSRDPRVFYFRALTLDQAGFEEKAKAAFHQGAELEAADPNVFPVGRSLERVQGRQRHLLESYRQKSRFEARRKIRLRNRARFSAPEDSLILDSNRNGLEKSDVDEDASDPFIGDQERPVGTGPVQPVPASEKSTKDVSETDRGFMRFEGDDEEALDMNEDDPFGDEGPGNDPFGDEDDPFGTSDAEDDTDPFGTSDDEDDTDPFGTSDDEDDTDPFGTDEEDPFG